jgi:hypothetical protein
MSVSYGNTVKYILDGMNSFEVIPTMTNTNIFTQIQAITNGNKTRKPHLKQKSSTDIKETE